jgi:hypothetical protein
MKNILGLLLGLLLTSCGVGFQYTALNHAGHVDGIYSSNDVVIEVPSNVQIDTLNEFQLRRKLRTDFQFRWDFAQYAMNQPYGWYMSNYSFNRWRPYNTFDVYWNSTQYWTDWAFNYPFQSNYYSWNRPYWGWNNSWWNGYNNWYNGPWHNPGYNVIWNRSQRNNVAYINGRRGSSNIQSRIVANNTNRTRVVTNKPRVNISQNNIDEIAINLRDKINNKPIRIYNNPNNPNINNNSKPRINNNNSKPRVYVRPNNNNNPRPVINNSTRSNNNTSIRSNPRRKN